MGPGPCISFLFHILHVKLKLLAKKYSLQAAVFINEGDVLKTPSILRSIPTEKVQEMRMQAQVLNNTRNER